MTSFPLTQSNITISPKQIHINFLYGNEENDPNKYISINEKTQGYLSKAKQLINDNYEQWDIYKKYTNPYEFIHTAYSKGCYVSTLRPISRAYYKMVELIKIYDLFKSYRYRPMRSFHLAEGPGGFIEAFIDKRNSSLDEYYGMTLISKDDSVPGWKKGNYLKNKSSNVIFEYGTTEDGDLYNYKNLEYIKYKYAGQFDIVTGDGGFDFSDDFSHQEQNAIRLIFSQMVFALFLQKDEGTFILKVFDMFSKPTLDVIFMLRTYYKEVFVCKPFTSRFANSEKYIVCKGFKRDKFMQSAGKLENVFKVFHALNFEKIHIASFLQCEYDYMFVKEMQKINTVLAQQQLEIIYNTVGYMYRNGKHHRGDHEKMQNVEKCITWCKQHNIPYNNYKKGNIFLSSR